MMHFRSKNVLANPQKKPRVHNPLVRSKSQLGIVSTNSQAYKRRLVIFTAFIALGTFFTLLLSHFFSPAQSSTSVGVLSGAEAEQTDFQSETLKPGTQHDAQQLASGSGSNWFGWLLWAKQNPKTASSSGQTLSAGGPGRAHTLVLYIFSNTDKEYFNNLQFFASVGIREDDGCDYIIINSSEGLPEVNLPQLPSNARYVNLKSKCMGDWGKLGWALKTQNINTASYTHFIFLNSSVRGPFLPTYIPEGLHFTQLMTSKLSDTVKLVGATVNCAGPVVLPEGQHRDNPHVQSYAIATDQTGLQVLLDDGKVFACYESMDEALYHSEMGSSLAILKAGYNLDSFMARYEGVDWRDKDNWGCNQKHNPFKFVAIDDMTLHPMELMFAKVKHWGVQLQYPSMRAAVQFDAWKEEPDVDGNDILDSYQDLTAGAILAAAAKGPDCWDCEYYIKHNPDIEYLKYDCFDAFSHFVNDGQFELRPHRWLCEALWEEHGVPFTPTNTGERWPLIDPNSCMRPDASYRTPSQSSAALLKALADAADGNDDEEEDNDDDDEDDDEDDLDGQTLQ